MFLRQCEKQIIYPRNPTNKVYFGIFEFLYVCAANGNSKNSGPIGNMNSLSSIC
jgi:hypothetical protein